MEPKILRVLIVEDKPENQDLLEQLFKDHAWVTVNRARRAIALIGAYDFDLICLDFDLAGPRQGDVVAEVIANSRNRDARILVHAQSGPGAQKIAEHLPQADLVPLSKITRNNRTFQRLRQELERGANIDWSKVFSSPRDTTDADD